MIFQLIYDIVIISGREHSSCPKNNKQKESQQCH
jgi:hypothetical protein